MTIPIRVESEADDELVAAFEWYEARRPGLGQDFDAQCDSTKVRRPSFPSWWIGFNALTKSLPPSNRFIELGYTTAATFRSMPWCRPSSRRFQVLLGRARPAAPGINWSGWSHGSDGAGWKPGPELRV